MIKEYKDNDEKILRFAEIATLNEGLAEGSKLIMKHDDTPDGVSGTLTFHVESERTRVLLEPTAKQEIDAIKARLDALEAT